MVAPRRATHPRADAYDATVPPEPTPDDSAGSPDSDAVASQGSDEAQLQAPREFESAAFTFEGQIERLQAMVVGINRRGGTTKKIAQVLVIGGLALFAVAYFVVIVLGVLG